MSYKKSHLNKSAKHLDDIKIKQIVKHEEEKQGIPNNRLTQIDVKNGRDRDIKFYYDNDSSNNKEDIKKDIANTRATQHARMTALLSVADKLKANLTPNLNTFKKKVKDN